MSEVALHEQRCVACEGGIAPLDQPALKAGLNALAECWHVDTLDQSPALSARFNFRNYYQVTAFVNAVAWIAHQENHHPDIHFGYRACTVYWTTHAASGITQNDLICAAKVDALLRTEELAP